jgi:hypothetical protein
MVHAQWKVLALFCSVAFCLFLLIVVIAPNLFAQASQSDLTHLPLGDGKISHTGPKVGYVYILRSNFRNGRSHSGDWIHDDGTFDLTEKPTVQGAVHWESKLDIKMEGDSRTLTGSSRVISGNALPDHATGIFPIAPTDPAHRYDPNPNAISKKLYSVTLPLDPKIASQSSPLTMGPIGIMLSGAFLFNALDDSGRDAEAHEIQDACQGHPQKFGIYHYHSFSTCIKTTDMPNSSQLVGYALDGFGIYVEYGADGKLLTNKDLDVDHGRTSEVKWNGKTENIYHYDVTHEYPYTIGAFKGTPVDFRLRPQPLPG